MSPLVEKILERLVYERLLLASGLSARRRQISLEEVLQAGTEEPRILQVLPAILLYKPTILKGLKRDLKRHPGLVKNVQSLFDPLPRRKDFYGIDLNDCQKAANAFRNYLQWARRKKRDRLFNLRLNEEDWNDLESLSKKLGMRNWSAVIRYLIHQAV